MEISVNHHEAWSAALRFRTIALVASLAIARTALAGPNAPSLQTLAISGAGAVHPLPQAAYQPRKDAIYRVVFAVTKAGEKPTDVSPSLERVARSVNLYVSAGVPLDHLKFVTVVYGPATAAMLDNEHYKTKFGVDNPNLELIRKLRGAGVDVAVCGQAVADGKFDYAWISHDVTLALSALTTITVLQQEGYSLMPL
jgi:intracellular sulfur oxidation DsrE/DsrF family protein